MRGLVAIQADVAVLKKDCDIVIARNRAPARNHLHLVGGVGEVPNNTAERPLDADSELLEDLVVFLL